MDTNIAINMNNFSDLYKEYHQKQWLISNQNYAKLDLYNQICKVHEICKYIKMYVNRRS